MPLSPYKGLMPYFEADAGFFFGREPEQEIITDNLLAWRLTLLYGASGVGKSSVLHAGVAHRLRELTKADLAARGAPKFIVVAFSSWRDDPLHSLKTRIRDTVAQLWEQPPEVPSELSLSATIRAWSERLDSELLFILDQFDEYFLYHPEGNGQFVDEFAEAVNRTDLRASFLISIRDDVTTKLDRFKGRIPNLYANYLRVEHLDQEAARHAILKPVERYNRIEGASVGVDPELVDAVLEQLRAGQLVVGGGGRGIVRGAAAEGRIEAAYLQLVMTRLWDEELRSGSGVLRLGTLKDLGWAENIVKTHLDKVMEGFAAAGRETAARAFHHLVTPSGTKIAHKLEDLAVYTELPEDQLQPVLEELCGSGIRILRSVRSPDQPESSRYEIYHDRLAAAIIDWRARYARAQELAEAERERAAQAERQKQELDRAQAEAAEQKRRAEIQEQLARRMRRRAVALGLLAALAIAALVFGMWQRSRALAIDRLMSSHRLAAVAVNELDTAPERSVLVAMYALASQSTPEAIDALNRSLLGSRLELNLVGHTDIVSAVAFSPDGKLLATASQDHTARIWDAAAGRLLHTLSGAGAAVHAVSFTRDGKRLATAGFDNNLRLWDVAAGKLLATVPDPEWISALACHPSQDVIATVGGRQGTVRIWDASAQPCEIRRWNVGGDVRALAFSIGGGALATAGADGVVRVWQVSDGKQTLTLKGHTDRVMSVAFSPDGRHLASGGMDRTVRIWNAKGETLHTLLTGHTNTVFAVAFDAAGRLASASADARVKVWDPLSGRELLSFAGHTNPVEGIAFSPDGTRLASASWDHTVKVWDTACHRDGIVDVAFSPGGDILATASRDRSVKLWESATGRVLRTLTFHKDEVTKIAFSRDGRLLATASNDGEAGIWEVASGSQILHLPANSPLYGLSFNPDATRIATGDDAGRVLLWELKAGVNPRTLGIHDEGASQVAFSPDGSLLASGSADDTVKLWNPASGTLVRTLHGHKRDVMGVAFSPDGALLATASLDGTAKLWEVSSGRQLRTISGHANSVNHVAFSPDGKYLATASWDRTARIWETATGREVIGFTHDSDVSAVAFSPDGKRLATASEDKAFRVYILDGNDLMEKARLRLRHLGRTLQPEECRKYLRSEGGCPPMP